MGSSREETILLLSLKVVDGDQDQDQDGGHGNNLRLPHVELIAKLRGQVLHVPDMLDVFSSWPRGGRNKYHARLKARFDELIEEVFPDEEMRKRAAKNDFAFFTSCWFPDADWDDLLTVGLFSFWLFHCDDAMDDLDGTVARDYAASCRYRRQVLDYTRWSLGLGPVVGDGNSKGWMARFLSWFCPLRKWSPPAPNLPNTVFKEYGVRTQAGTSKVFREMFWAEIKQYIDHCEIEQRERMTGEMADTLDGYLRIRHHTSAVRAYGFVTQQGTNIRLSVSIMKSPQMQALWDEITIIIIIINDILSVKKELAAGAVHNAVPVMYSLGKPLDVVMGELMVRLASCRDRFDGIAQSVLAMARSESEKKDLEKFIDGLRTNATGTIEFCKLADRYRNEKYFNEDGSMDVVL
ncbi:Presilphiperfolan-8-beta-ol synthase [Echria macrotheca]|uniref:Terpene synthase n=1 Tax=Echria macrotheca TaxID=438768 RepID=A0AAJ0B8C2_9PEZI|nr:Presilphiperfolan-8-beta-ol synthase [Echria macrotheca]